MTDLVKRLLGEAEFWAGQPSGSEIEALCREAAAVQIAMLEALQAAHNLYIFAAAGAFENGNKDATGSIDEGEARTAAIAEQIRAAIAKATGTA